MNTASLELSKELYELSGGKLLSEWGSTYFYYTPDGGSSTGHTVIVGTRSTVDIPAYDLGYLLRKLPPIVTLKSRAGGRWSAQLVKGQLVYSYQEQKDEIKKWEVERTADTPEDAACKLAIELFKQGVLK